MFLDGRKKPGVTSTKWWYGTEEAIAEVMQLLAYLCYRAAEQDDEAWESLDLDAAMADGDIQINGLLISEFLRQFEVSSLEVARRWLDRDALGGIRTLSVRAVITVEDPNTGEETVLYGEAILSPDSGLKGEVTLQEMLEVEREELLGPTEPSAEAEKTEAVQTCSDTTIIWKGA